MKQLAIFWLTAMAILWTACGDDDTNSSSQQAGQTEQVGDEGNASDRSVAASSSPTSDIAISLWDQAGLRDAPGRGKGIKYLATINFGEVVTLTGEEKQIEGDSRNYIEMQLSDGKVGWSYDYLFALDALRAAALQDIELYKRPDLTTFAGKKFERGEIFAVKSGDRDDWVEVLGKEKKKEGWIRKDAVKYSTDEIDVTVAILIDRAVNESDPTKREEALKQIAENSTFSSSPMLSLVDEKLADIPTIPELPANQLYITTENLNVRSEPDTEAENVVFQVTEGDICTIIERGDLASIRDMEDYWYNISFNGQEGWIFGHFTSKRLAE